MHAGTPIVATNLIEVAKVINKHSIGVIIEELTVKSLIENISFLLENPEKLNEYKHNCAKASTIENWEKESETLLKIYPKVD